MNSTETAIHDYSIDVMRKFIDYIDKIDGISRYSLLALDPGLTTGWALFKYGTPYVCGQSNTREVASMCERIESLTDLIPDSDRLLVVEDYFIYPSKAKDHIYSTVPVARLIGCIETIAYQRYIRVVFQSASSAKGLVSDDRLLRHDLYVPGMPHAMDAIRHGLYYVLAGRH